MKLGIARTGAAGGVDGGSWNTVVVVGAIVVLVVEVLSVTTVVVVRTARVVEVLDVLVVGRRQGCVGGTRTLVVGWQSGIEAANDS